MQNFGTHLKSLRKEKGMRQKDLADALGLAQTTIANYEQNTRFPNEETLKNISDFFNVSLDYLLGRADYDQRETSVKPPINDMTTLDAIYKSYLAYVITGRKELAESIIMYSVKHGTDVRDIYMNVLEPALKEIGSLWEQGKITVADEHYASIVTEHVMSKILPLMRSYEENHSLLALTVGGESHTIGIRMVSDFFKMAGWNTYFLGASTPTDSIVSHIIKYKIDLLALSVSMNYHINSLEMLISTIRNHVKCKDVKIIVGGQAFLHNPNLWQRVGADGYAANAMEAVLVGNQLVEKAK